MGLINRWRTKRRVKKQIDALMNYIEEQLNAGVHPDDMLVYEINKAIEWDVAGGFWKIYFSGEAMGLSLPVGELVYLVTGSGRGGCAEHARVVEALGDGWYSVRFDVENRA